MNAFLQTDTESSDRELIALSLAGNKAALEKLIKTHHQFIYNVALKLFLSPEDARDATQEVLIKVITRLKTFEGNSQFRTWLYRIVINHFLNTQASKEKKVQNGLQSLAGFAEEPEPDEISEAVKEEVRILCSTAMLMCLDREQRLLYIIGEVFEANHHLGAELFDLSPANYRVKLHRAKTDLHQFVQQKCGLINPDNPCRCRKKAKKLVAEGVVDVDEMVFNRDFQQTIAEVVRSKKDSVSDRIQFELKDLFHHSPFQIKKELDDLLHDLIQVT